MFKWFSALFVLATARRIEREVQRRLDIAETVQRFIIDMGHTDQLARYMLINHNWVMDPIAHDELMPTA